MQQEWQTAGGPQQFPNELGRCGELSVNPIFTAGSDCKFMVGVSFPVDERKCRAG